jgi:hypothetical protein
LKIKALVIVSAKTECKSARGGVAMKEEQNGKIRKLISFLKWGCRSCRGDMTGGVVKKEKIRKEGKKGNRLSKPVD